MLINWKSENATNIQDKNIRVLKVIKEMLKEGEIKKK